jgi:hypothetical protein
MVQGTGWRAFIHEPGSGRARQEVLYTVELDLFCRVRETLPLTLVNRSCSR